MVVTSGLELVAREDERARLRQFIGDLADDPSGVVIRGDAGIGKTMLWRTAVEAAGQAGVKVLLTRCAEAEMPLALGGLADLLEDAFSEVEQELAAHQRKALALAVGAESPTEEASAGIALPRAFLACLRSLADRGPVLVAIDDVQWLDPPSRRIIAFALKRLGDAPVGILATQRGDTDDPLDLHHALDEWFAEIRLGPLSSGALHHLVRTRLGVRIPRPLMARVHEASGGNPMFALEFARSLVGRHRPQLGPMSMPESLQELVNARVRDYPQNIRRLLAIVAAADHPTPSLLAAVDARVSGVLHAALDTGGVVIDDDGVIRFTHPLLASSAYGELRPPQRRTLHAHLADVSEDVEERARHRALASAEPDATTAAFLDEAAAHASARGAPEAAAELAEEAVRLTPAADVSERDERALAVAVYLGDAGRTADAADWLDRRLAAGLAGPRRARALLLRVGIVEHDLEAGCRALTEALEHVGEDKALRARALLWMSGCQLYRGDLGASEEAARQAQSAAEEAGDPALLASALAVVADRADLARRPENGLLDRAIALAEVHGTEPLRPTLRCVLGERLLREGNLNGARALLEVELGAAFRAGIEPARYRILRSLVDVEWRAGDWQVAERYLDEAWEFVVDSGGLWAEAEVLERKGRLAALRGDVDDARSFVAQGIARAEAMHWPHLAAMNRWVLGFLELSLGEPARAWQALQDVPRTPTWGRLEVVNAMADGVEILVAVGQLEAADELLAQLQDEARDGHLWAAAAALRCTALLLLARGDAAAAVAAATDAADRFEVAGCRLDRGRALLVGGEALHRLGERRLAAVELAAARAVCAELGAPLWLDRAEKELRRASPRPRHDRELTNAERRVASLVAAGRTNREVSAQLFTTVGTVEVHLTRVYRKLGLRSRTELARAVAEGTLDLSDV